jgi:HSP20 family protein
LAFDKLSGNAITPEKEKSPMDMIRYQPYSQSELSTAFDRLATLREEMDRLFDSPFGSFLRSPASLRSWSPPLDVYQDKDNFTIVVDLPGLKKENIDISLRGETLTISGERKAEEKKGEQGFRAERFYGSFQRTVKLPALVDPNKVKASYQEGILKVLLAKAEEAKPKQIAVSLS